jgi:methyltransferase OMS1
MAVMAPIRNDPTMRRLATATRTARLSSPLSPPMHRLQQGVCKSTYKDKKRGIGIGQQAAAAAATSSTPAATPTPTTTSSSKWSAYLPWVAGGLAVYGAGVAATLLYFSGGNVCDRCVTEQERRQAYDTGAATYEKDVIAGESWYGILDLRKKLMRHASGRVLEVAAGTAVNVVKNFYPKGCTVVATDCSPAMVAVATRTLQGRGSGRGGVDAAVESVVQMDADRLGFDDGAFDTVVDTFGLCSFEDPVATLHEMRRVCRVGGRVLLLEHGRSSWGAVNYLLDRSSTGHAARWGCFWNRDIQRIVAAVPGFQVVEQQRHHLGTTSVYVLERVR